MNRIVLAITALFHVTAMAGKYEFLDRFEGSGENWVREAMPSSSSRLSALNVSLAPFYQDFQSDKKVSFYIGFGKDAYTGYRVGEISTMLVELAKFHGMSFTNWSLDEHKEHVSFDDPKSGITYEIQVGHELNEFKRAFEHYDVVLYHGHSRYGRGPTFDDYTNYFRMGNNYRTIEVDATSTYYKSEPIQLTGQYPVQDTEVAGERVRYQYQGQKDETSFLEPTTYTKNIPGLDADLRAAKYLPTKQIFYFYSCSNIDYWKSPIRKLFSTKDKVVFGTRSEGWWGSKPTAVLIMSIVSQVGKSGAIVDELNATDDCKRCFTAY